MWQPVGVVVLAVRGQPPRGDRGRSPSTIPERGTGDLSVSTAGDPVTVPLISGAVPRPSGEGRAQCLPAPSRKRAVLVAGVRSSRRRSWALSATTTVDADMRMAPTLIGSTNPTGASTPAASGTETRL